MKDEYHEHAAASTMIFRKLFRRGRVVWCDVGHPGKTAPHGQDRSTRPAISMDLEVYDEVTMARRMFLRQLATLPFLGGMTGFGQVTPRKSLNVMMKSAWGSDDPTKAAFPF